MFHRNRTKKILVVDDDAGQRLLLQMALENRGYQVLTADNGEEASAIFEREPDIRLLISDLIMPRMDGLALTKRIRASERQYTYIIILTSSSDRKSVTRLLKAGADDFLFKPVVEDELFLRIKAGERLMRLESQEALIFTMAKLAEYRSHETGLHLERVRFYTRLLAQDLFNNHPELGLNAASAEEIARVSPLHDLGKISIPDNILHKPGRLTDEEFTIMKQHTVYGGNILLDLYEQTEDNYLMAAYQVAMYHHEKWDGTGYPQGLAGEEIPIEARIVALADVYDAISSQRCYKEAISHSQARTIILDGKGRHFDPMVVESFLRQEDIWIGIREKYADRP